MKNFLIRIAIAIPLAGLFIFCNVSDALGRIPFLMFVGILMHLTLHEMLAMATIASRTKIITHFFMVFTVFFLWLPLYIATPVSSHVPFSIHDQLKSLESSNVLIVNFLFLIVIYTETILSDRTEKSLQEISVAAFSVLFIGTLFAAYCSLLALNLYYIFLVAMGTFLGDTACLIAGKALGKNKIGLKISPNKTWEGYIIGLPATVLIILITDYIYRQVTTAPAHGLSFLILTSILIFIFTILGDLIESAFKRSVELKDSGRLPGHGGFLDMLDSMALTVPAMWLWVSLN